MTQGTQATHTCTEHLVPGPALAMAGLLGGSMPDLSAGLPPLWHWLYLLDRPAEIDLGRDGHPIRNTAVAPPGKNRRRMWAGGLVRSLAPLRLDHPATRSSWVSSQRDTVGKSGALTFVTIAHRVSQHGRVVVDEEQRLVYREAGRHDHQDSEPPTTRPEVEPEPDEWSIAVTPPLLFRFSALTYNAHRIHYDREYTRSVEGYPGLVVHGPLQALVMAEAARRRMGTPTTGVQFEYRLVSPLFDDQGLIVSTSRIDHTGAPTVQEISTAVRDRSGRRTALGALLTSSVSLSDRYSTEGEH